LIQIHNPIIKAFLSPKALSIMNDMEEIIDVFHRATTLTTYNPSPYDVELYQATVT